MNQTDVPVIGIVVVIRGEDYFPTISRPRWTEARRTEMGYLALIAAVGVHDPKVHLVGSHQSLGEKILVRCDLRRRLRVIRAVHYPFPVRGPPRASIVSQLVRQLLQPGSVDIHHVNVQVTAL